ncbi:MAG: SUMF1/EgtB/PvdO family nonheme iron enzyme [Paludibacteraceae bacterium]
MSDGILFSNYRLPTEAEWEFAAYAIKSDKQDGLVNQGKIYPWNGNQLRNTKKGKFLGEMQANYVRGRGDMMGTSGSLNDKAVITAPVDWYTPNAFGLYNMAGNVNEWVMDVYRSETYDDVSEYNSFRGNAYQTAVATSMDDIGNYVLKIDSLGRVVTAVKPGDDVRGFHDGDETTRLSTDFQMFTDPEGIKALSNHEKLDPTDILAPKITNKTRVYKGGSWKDRAYWLNPSTRRYLDQDKCTNDIGFRCAMSMIGDVKSQTTTTRRR